VTLHSTVVKVCFFFSRFLDSCKYEAICTVWTLHLVVAPT